MSRIRTMVVEDGFEYVEALGRFLGDDLDLVRAGDGVEALRLFQQEGPWDAIYLDMRFDRAERLLGDVGALVDRFAGDTERARRFLEDNQGAYVLAALREAGCTAPAVFSYDFAGEPRRFANLSARYAPLDWLSDTAGPAEVRRKLRGIVG